MNLGKNANSAGLCRVIIQKVGFVWRQLEFAFFGALTSVGALFVFLGGLNNGQSRKKQKIE